MTDVEKAVFTFKKAMPALAEAFGESEVRASVENVVGRNVDPGGPARNLVLGAMAGDLDDAGLRLMVEVAEDLRDRLL